MYKINEKDSCGPLPPTSELAFGNSNQEMGDFDKKTFDMILQDATFLNCTAEWDENDTLTFCGQNGFLSSVSDFERPYGDGFIDGGILGLDLMGDSWSPSTDSDYASSGSDCIEEIGGTLSAQTKVHMAPTRSSPDSDLLHMYEGAPAGTLTGLNSNGAGKRPRPVMPVEEGDGRNRKSTARSYQNGMDQRRSFACPYRKLDPHRHRDCLKYTLHRIKDVKQHIDRRHRKPDVYCARCYATFRSQTERDEHTRDSRCEILPRTQVEGVTDEQRENLNKSSCRNLPLEEQWFRMWEVLFPGEDRPRSAFSGNYVEEVVPLLRHYWVGKSSAIIDSATQGYETAHVDRGLLHRLMDTVFDRLEVEVGRLPHSSDLDSNLREAGQESHSKRSRTH